MKKLNDEIKRKTSYKINGKEITVTNKPVFSKSTQKKFSKIYDNPDKHISRKRHKVKQRKSSDSLNLYTEIETKNLLNEITNIESTRQKLDSSKIALSYDEILNTNEPKLRKIIKFFKSNSDSAELLLSYIYHIENESEQSINNRDKIIIEKNKFIYAKYNELIEANKRIIEISNDMKELGKKKIETDCLTNELNILQDKYEYLQDVNDRKQTASQKYTINDFNQYKELYNELGFNYKVAFFKLQEITTNEHIKKTNYTSFHTSYRDRIREK